jgi:hypothetical protein
MGVVNDAAQPFGQSDRRLRADNVGSQAGNDWKTALRQDLGTASGGFEKRAGLTIDERPGGASLRCRT